MDSVLAIIGLFILRLGVPIAFMVLLAWAVNWYARYDEQRELEARQRAAIAEVPAAPEQCWDVKGCTEETRADCPAVRRPDLPCWLAKQLSTGRLSPSCQACAMYKKTAEVAAATVRT